MSCIRLVRAKYEYENPRRIHRFLRLIIQKIRLYKCEKWDYRMCNKGLHFQVLLLNGLKKKKHKLYSFN